MGEPMRVRAVLNGNVVEVKVLMKHRMLSRLSWSTDGQLILPHFIQTVRGTCNGKQVLHVHFGGSVGLGDACYREITGIVALEIL